MSDRDYDADRLARREAIEARLRAERAEAAAEAEAARLERLREFPPREVARIYRGIRREMRAIDDLLAGGDDDLDGEYRSGLR